MSSLWTLSALLVFLLVVSFLGPALLLTKRFRGTALERLTAGFGLTGIVLYLLTFAIYAFDLPQLSHWAVTAACVVALLFSLGELRRLWADPSLRLPGLAFLFLAFWVTLHLLIVRNFSGGGWAADWFEHYERALFFYLRAPLHTRFVGFYGLPARPPLMNLLISHAMVQVGPSFVLYQVATSVMGLLVCLPLFLFAQVSERRGGRAVLLLVFLSALNPMFLENATYPWTRHFANFYILSGLYFYWRGTTENNASRIGLALLFFAAAVLVHYSAVPYAVCVLGHLAFRVVKSDAVPVKNLAPPALAAGLLLLTWFGWSLAHFGPLITLGSNTTVRFAQGRSEIDFLSKFFYNLSSTLIPHWFRNPNPLFLDQEFFWGKLRDSFFLVAQTNLIAAPGIIGGVLLLCPAARDGCRGTVRDPAWRFWVGLTAAVILLSIAVNDRPDFFGVAHICLQPIILLGLARLSVVAWEWGGFFRFLLGLGALVDYALGILLQFWLESLSFAGREHLLGAMSTVTRSNWQTKVGSNLLFLGDYAADYQKVFLAAEIFTAGLLFAGYALWCRGSIIGRTQAFDAADSPA